MADAVSNALVVELLLKYAGPAAVILALVVFGAVMVVRHWLTVAARKSDADRREHMAKWDTLVQSHKEESERQFRLFERQAETLELHASALIKLTTLIEANQWCPLQRSKGEPK